jgi:hypothetical protein
MAGLQIKSQVQDNSPVQDTSGEHPRQTSFMHQKSLHLQTAIQKQS